LAVLKITPGLDVCGMQLLADSTKMRGVVVVFPAMTYI
jgi:hypothetical protein